MVLTYNCEANNGELGVDTSSQVSCHWPDIASQSDPWDPGRPLWKPGKPGKGAVACPNQEPASEGFILSFSWENGFVLVAHEIRSNENEYQLRFGDFLVFVCTVKPYDICSGAQVINGRVGARIPICCVHSSTACSSVVELTTTSDAF